MTYRSFFVCLWLLGWVAASYGQREATLLQHKDRIRITPLSVLNSGARETNLSITPDGRYLYFMSLRGGQWWSHKYMTWGQDSVYDGDVWFSEKVNGEWQPPQCLPYGINTSSGEDEPNISPNGRKVYYQSWRSFWAETSGPYYQAELTAGKWGKPEGLGSNITKFFLTTFIDATDGMSVSPDGRRLVIACGYEYDAPMDLYMSEKGAYGWTYPRKLSLSTEGDERSVFLAADGRTLYFASDGYEGLGGLDLFKASIREDGSIGEVINLGEPFNTSGDDYGFILTGDGDEGYFIRNGDIYFADLREADEKLKPDLQVSLTGMVRDSATNLGLPADVVLMDARTKRVVKKISTNSRGAYETSIPNADAVYDQVIVSEGYPQASRRIKVTESEFRQSFESNFFLAKKNSQPVIAREEKPVLPPPVPVTPPVAQAQKEKEEEKKPELPPVVLNPIAPSPQETDVRPQEVNPADITIELEEAEDPYDFSRVAENNLVLLLDVSASMNKFDKLPVLKEAIKTLVSHMRPEDRISLVAYSSSAEVILDGVSAAQQQTIAEKVDGLRTSGGTKSKSALKKAYNLAEDYFVSGGNNRIIMATDGFFDVSDLMGLAEKHASEGIKLSVFSFGKMGVDKYDVLDNLAEKGEGNHANITRENVDIALLREAKAVRK